MVVIHPSHQISERKNFKNATAVNAKAKKPSKRTSTVDRRNVSDKEGSVNVGGGGIASVSDSEEAFIRAANCIISASTSSETSLKYESSS